MAPVFERVDDSAADADMAESQEIQEWRIRVTDQMATLLERVEGRGELLGRIQKDIEQLQERMKIVEAHPMSCFLKDRMSALEVTVRANQASTEASTATARHWESWIRPVLIAVVTFLGGLILGLRR
jgi:hypothetical protein